MVPKAHRLSVDDQVMLDLLRLGSQAIVVGDIGIHGLTNAGIVHVSRSSSHTSLDGRQERHHGTQQGIQPVAITSRLRRDFLQNLALDRRQGVPWRRCGIMSAILVPQMAKVETAADCIEIVW